MLGKCGVLAKSIEKHFFKKSTNDPMVSRNRDAAIGAITSLEAAVKAAPESEEAKILHITHE